VTRSQTDRDDPTGSPDAAAGEWDAEPELEIRTTACSTAPGRTLLVEEGNRDGWLSSDLVVDISDVR
jgi:hypothetical protein